MPGVKEKSLMYTLGMGKALVEFRTFFFFRDYQESVRNPAFTGRKCIFHETGPRKG